LPILIDNPGESLTKSPEGLQKLEELHGQSQIMLQSIPMGFAGAKLALTDVGYRSQIEAELDEVVRRRIPTGDILKPTGSYKESKWTSGIKSYNDLLRFVKSITERGDPDEVSLLPELQARLGVPILRNHQIAGCFPYPLIKALNGDDNISVNPARVGEGAQRHLQINGQGVEDTKTASSRKYCTYCQKAGRSPIAMLVQILLGEAHRCALDPSRKKWNYAAHEGKTYLVLEKARARLFTQAFKGSDATLKGQGKDTARALAISRSMDWMTEEDQLLCQLLFAEAFPEQYRTAPVAAYLPEAYGGCDYPHVYKTVDIVEALEPEHRIGVHEALYGSPTEVCLAKDALRRSFRTVTKDPKKLVDTLQGVEIVEKLNKKLTEEGFNEIEIVSHIDARLESISKLEEVSRKTNRLGMDAASSSGDSTSSSGISREEKTMIHRLFVPVSSLPRELESSRVLPQILEKKMREEIPQNPRKDLLTSLRRIKKTFKQGTKDQEEITASIGQLPMRKWNHKAVGDRDLQLFIRREHVDAIRHPQLLSLRLERGHLHGICDQTFTGKIRNRNGIRTVTGEEPRERPPYPPRLKETARTATDPTLNAFLLIAAEQLKREEEDEQESAQAPTLEEDEDEAFEFEDFDFNSYNLNVGTWADCL
jgi:hypothetical protein